MLSSLVVALVVAYLLTQLRFVALCSLAPRVAPTPAPVEPLANAPMVVVQIAAYREALALPTLLQAIVELDWPMDRCVIQVIDDSSGTDAAATRNVVERFSNAMVRIEYRNRGSRAGFKAGALNHGVDTAEGVDLIAYFDADCRPRRDFLRRLVPRFSDPQVAAVQARWEYPNGNRSPVTIVQQAAFEYLFRYEYGLRASLGSPVYYLGSAAIWRRRAIAALGGWETRRFTAEDVDMGIRARAAGWKVLYEPAAVADNDAVEDILAFRAQQRRWAHAVMRAGLDGARGLFTPGCGWRALLLDATGLMPHGSVVLVLLTTVCIIAHTMLGQVRSPEVAAAERIFAALVALSPGIFAQVAAMRYFHPDRWRSHAAALARGGPAAAATMTSFLFGLGDLAVQRRVEFVATPKGGQVAVVRDSRRRWVQMHYGPVAFDGAIAILLLAGAAVASARRAPSAAVPAAILGPAFAASFLLTLREIRRHGRTDVRAAASSSTTPS